MENLTGWGGVLLWLFAEAAVTAWVASSLDFIAWCYCWANQVRKWEQKRAEKREHLSEPDGFNTSPLTHVRASVLSKILLLKLLALIEITEQVGGSLLNATRSNGSHFKKENR